MRRLRARDYRVVEGEFYGTPKELWGFRSTRGSGSARAIARSFLSAHCDLLGLEPDLESLRWRRTVSSLGADHVIFEQVHERVRIHRAYVTVHVGRSDRRVFLVKNRAAPRGLLPRRPRAEVGRSEAIRLARRSIGTTARGARLLGTERVWCPKARDLRISWKVRLHRERPREEWIHYVDAVTGEILSEYDNLAAATGRAWVFDPNPVVTLDGADDLLTPAGTPRRRIPDEAFFEVSLPGLGGRGTLDGRRATTRPTSRRVRRRSHDFRFDARERGFEEVMAYHHVDRAIRYLESLGFRGRRAIFREPLRIRANGTRRDNSWYSPGLRQLTFGTGGVDDAEDAETILHEFGHALQDAITPDFGQSEEAAAMGEGFGDYFAASYFRDAKSLRYAATVMSWDGVTWERDDGPPCVRRVDMHWTLDDWVPGDPEHDNGEIWSATLWDVRNALGGELADRLIVESHFQLDPFTTLARGARAILDADANLERGRHRRALRRIFRSRRIGPF